MKEFRYLPSDIAEKVAGVIDQFVSGQLAISKDELFEKLTSILIVNKMKRETVYSRLEGYYHASDLLFTKVAENTGLTRQDIVSRANLRPLSHYHYMTGSREPSGIVLKRQDLFNDPATAMTKLKDDILGLAGILSDEIQGLAGLLSKNETEESKSE